MTIGELYRLSVNALEKNGFDNAAFETYELLQMGGISKIKVITEPHENVPKTAEKLIKERLEKRISGYPLQYLAGEWEFCGLPFKVGEGVLIPRQDTETLVEFGVEFLKKNGGHSVLDLCAGSGCIGIALAKLAKAEVICAELYDDALNYLNRNIELNEVGQYVRVVKADVTAESASELFEGNFDLIVSNPPYLTEHDMSSLQKEVSFEPKSALYGGRDGLDFYRKLISIYPQKLKSGGALAFEIGAGQEDAVGGIFEYYNIKPSFKNDLSGTKRVIYGTFDQK